MVRACTSVTSLVILISLEIIQTHCVEPERLSVSDTTHKYLPQQSDLIVYLKSLRRIIKFCLNNKNDLDLNFAFGMFLVNVNLKSVLEKKQIGLPKLKQYINFLLRENDDLMIFFQHMISENDDIREDANKLITTLFSNETVWIMNIQKFDKPLIEGVERQVEDLPWSEYVIRVDDIDSWVPSPKQSDLCMISIAGHEVHEAPYAKCIVDKACYDMLINGTDFGYALTHRLLFLLHAMYARGCTIFSTKKDRRLMENYCTMAYEEAEYIASNSYDAVDLILEQMILCAMAGKTRFLQRHWLSNILRFQTSFGCFGQSKSNPKLEAKILRSSFKSAQAWKPAKHRNHTIVGGLCNGHVTSVAAATLAAAIRLILEIYY